MSVSTYPVRVDAQLDAGLSRWLWLVKWLLAIPHFVVLAFLWVAFVVLQRGRVRRDPVHRPLPARDLRLQRRGAALDAGGSATTPTARSAPTATRRSRSRTCPDYPAHLDVAYPEHLSRGLVLVKWWLLAIPHYLVLALFVGGGVLVSDRPRTRPARYWAGAAG